VRSFPVEAPEPVPAILPALGRLGPWLARLAAAQGSWPPALPSHVVPAPTTSGVDAGAEAADRLVDAGADLLVVAGGGPTGPALALLAVLLDLEPVAAVGTGSVPGWAGLVAEVRTGLRAARPHLGDPDRLLAVTGADEVAGLAGLLLQAAVRRTPVLLSGAADAWAAALLAERTTPGTADWLLPGCSPAGGGAAAAVSELRLEPLLDLRLAGPEGADLALAVLGPAVRLAQAGVGGGRAAEGRQEDGPGHDAGRDARGLDDGPAHDGSPDDGGPDDGSPDPLRA